MWWETLTIVAIVAAAALGAGRYALRSLRPVPCGCAGGCPALAKIERAHAARTRHQGVNDHATQ
jgi:hypothetical protein